MLDVTPVQIADYISAMDYGGIGFRGQEHHTIVDESGLQGRYDFTMEFALSQGPQAEPESTAPDFIQALKEQLGLKLVTKKESVRIFVVDHVERPTEN
jgi:uncharacterized protein (TIGR03435 family)